MDIQLTVQGMSCGNCEKAVQHALSGLDGVINVSVNLADKSVLVSFAENKVTIEQIKDAIEDQGYDVVA